MPSPADSIPVASAHATSSASPVPAALAPVTDTRALRLAGISDCRRVPAFNVAENARILLRYEFIERRLFRILAGWMPGTARWEAKILIGRLVGEDSEHT